MFAEGEVFGGKTGGYKVEEGHGAGHLVLSNMPIEFIADVFVANSFQNTACDRVRYE